MTLRSVNCAYSPTNSIELKNHLIIGGTGRAGTSFLVQYLTACGFETHITRNPAGRLDENANAGLEDVPTSGADLPYVIKSPWLYEFVDELLERDDIRVDAVILPMRDIVEAATSRVVNELRARLGREDLPEGLTQWHTWGTTAGGIVYSLNPIDQARLLSMGFHEVVYACVKKRIPLIFLAFPAFISDGEYLYEQLLPVLQGKVDRAAAMRAHAATADLDKVRVDGELTRAKAIRTGDMFPGLEELDRAALYREISNARRERDAFAAESASLIAAMQELDSRLSACVADGERATGRAAEELRHARAAAAEELQHARTAAAEELERLKGQFERQQAAMTREFEQRLRTAIQERDVAVAEADSRRAQLATILGSSSWRLTGPFRKLGTMLRRKSA